MRLESHQLVLLSPQVLSRKAILASNTLLFGAAPPPPAPPDPDLDLTVGRFLRRTILYGLPMFLLGLVLGIRGCPSGAPDNPGASTHTGKSTPKSVATPHKTKKAAATKKDH